VSDNADTINMALLRQQQQRLAVVKAVKIFFGNQNFLRTILKQQVLKCFGHCTGSYFDKALISYS
jgi:hypothetical protein